MAGIGELLGSLGGLAAGIGSAAGGVGQSGFQARDNAQDSNAGRYGGNTQEEKAFQDASSEYGNALRAMQEEQMRQAQRGVRDPNALAAAQARVRDAEARMNQTRDAAAKAGSYVEQERERMRQMGANAQNRPGAQMNLGAYNQDRAQAQQSREGMADVAASFRDAAMGKGPSAAQAQLQSGLDQAAKLGQATAASYRGGALGRNEMASRALAGSQNAASGAVSEAAALRAKEQQAGMQGWGQSASALGQRDASQQGLSLQQATSQAGLDNASADRNDKMTMFGESLAQDIDKTQLGAKLQQEAGDQAAATAADKTNAGVATHNADAGAKNFEGAVGAGMGAVTAIDKFGGGKKWW